MGQINITLDDKSLALIKEAAELEGRSVSGFTRLASKNRACEVLHTAGIDYTRLGE